MTIDIISLIFGLAIGSTIGALIVWGNSLSGVHFQLDRRMRSNEDSLREHDRHIDQIVRIYRKEPGEESK